MPTIDADAHVIETERTWEFMEGSMEKFRPRVVTANDDGRDYWMIDGRVFNRRVNMNRELGDSVLQMREIDSRLKHMDELGVDTQVLYTSLFLRPVTSKPEVETALFRSYNRWLAEIWRKGQDRLRWVAMVPLMDLGEGLAEVRFAKENGACGIFMRGLVDDKILSDPYFFPLYEEAARLDMPICVHASTGNFDWVELFGSESGFAKFKLAVLTAFHCIAYEGVTARFPGLRFGFIEVRAQWVPYMVADILKRFEQKGKPCGDNLLRDNHLYVACQTDDDMPWVLKYAGEDNIVIGSDYGHADTSSEIEALRSLKSQEGVSPEVIDKILYDNSKALYGL
jgi:predicted TIM-barrel fold metal-dependent hydrolase